MIKHVRTTVATAAALALLTGCADTDGMGAGTDPDPAPQEDSDDDQDDEEADEAADDLDVDEDDDSPMEQTIHEFDDPFVWEEGGVRVSVTGLGINRIDDDTPADVADWLEDDTNTVVVLDITASNDHGEAINLYLNQGELQVEREQVEADMFLSDSFAGSEMRDGTDDNGEVFWQLTTEYEDVVAAGTLDYVFSGPGNAETFERIVDGNVEMTIEWDD